MFLPDTAIVDSTAFNVVDLVLVLVLVLGLWRGWRKGAVAGSVELLCLGGGALMAFFATQALADMLARNAWVPEPWASPLVFVLLFAAVSALLGGLLRPTRSADVPRSAKMQIVDRGFGLVPGAVNGSINAMVLSVLASALPLNDGITRATQGSILVEHLAVPALWLEHQLAPIFNPAVERTMQGLVVQPESLERVQLPFSVSNPQARPDLEAAMLELVNAERQKAGVRALLADAESVPVSRAHSTDMFARRYFAHVSPEGRTPFDRLRHAGLRYRAAGENLALARTLQMAHQGLMQSPGHRANILNSAFGRVGIGIVDGGRHGLMITQTFRN